MLIALALPAMAQNDLYGAIDTISIDQESALGGSSLQLSVNLFNDEALTGITLPLRFPADKLTLDSVIFKNTRIDYIGWKPAKINQSEGNVVIGALVTEEDYIPAGEGEICRLQFTIKDGAIPGEILTIDTTTVEPAELLLTSSVSTSINPVFNFGAIAVMENAGAPIFSPVGEKYVREGDTLIIELEAVDPEGDDIIITNPVHPLGSSFTDNGDGTAIFTWVPSFIGAGSADLSPYEFTFRASDGSANSGLDVKVSVLNVNQAPVISALSGFMAEAGETIDLTISATDPDIEDITWNITGLPDGAIFDGANPGRIYWETDFDDSGSYAIEICASDAAGLTDTAGLALNMTPVVFYALTPDIVNSWPGDIFEYEISLDNQYEVDGFDLLIYTDPSVITPLTVTLDETRAAGFNSLTYEFDEYNNKGYIHIIGQADGADPLEPGKGAVCRLTLQVINDLNFVGVSAPVYFRTVLSTDNTLALPDGTTIGSTEIEFSEGAILIEAPEAQLLGDINLNGIAFEVADAIYFMNFYISPSQYPLDDVQILNSDINRDGQAPSLADLVELIKVVSGEQDPPSKVVIEETQVDATLVAQDDGLYLQVNAPVALGGLYVRLTGTDIDRADPVNMTDMELSYGEDGGNLNCVLVSFENKNIASGESLLLKISSDTELDLTVSEAEAADTDGRAMEISFKESTALPNNFALHQNYPNPFNPSTEISFNLERKARVTLVIYNVLGQEIVRLVDDEVEAGHHKVTWDATDSNDQRVSSGIYFYRLVSDDYRATRKMVLLK